MEDALDKNAKESFDYYCYYYCHYYYYYCYYCHVTFLGHGLSLKPELTDLASLYG